MKNLRNLSLSGKKESLIFIPFNTPSLKNSKVKTGRGIFASKTVKKYLMQLGIQHYSPSKKTVKGYVDKKRPNLFEGVRKQFELEMKDKDQPYLLACHFVRNSKRDFDFNNATQIIMDLMVAHDMVEDDCMRVLIPVPLMIDEEWYSIDKENPGVYIKII